MVIRPTGDRKIHARLKMNWPLMDLIRVHPCSSAAKIVFLLLAALSLPAQDVVTLEQTGSRTGPDFEPAYAGRAIHRARANLPLR